MAFSDAWWYRILGDRDSCDHDLAFVFNFPHTYLLLQFCQSPTELIAFLVVVKRAGNSDSGNGDQHNPQGRVFSKQGDLDAILLALPINEEHIQETVLFKEPFFFTASKQHPKANQDSVSLGDLEDEQVLLLEDGHCLRDQALDVCSVHRAVENTNFRATSLETLRQMVAADAGITLMPQLAVQKRSARVRYLPFEEESPHRVIGLCWRTTSTRTPLLKEMSQVLVDLGAQIFND